MPRKFASVPIIFSSADPQIQIEIDGLPSLEGLEQIPDDRDKQQLQQNECGSQGRIKDAQSGSGE
jgi:hypothetical protein